MKTDKWRVYKERESRIWRGAWIVAPPHAAFDDCYAFGSWRHALAYAVDQAHCHSS